MEIDAMRTQYEMWHELFKYDHSLKSGTTYLIQYRKYWRKILSESQNHRCCWCGCETHLDEPKDSKYATIEHIAPKSEGGSEHPDNYAMSCKECNNRRKSKSIEEFMYEIEFKEINKNKNYIKTFKFGIPYYST